MEVLLAREVSKSRAKANDEIKEIKMVVWIFIYIMEVSGNHGLIFPSGEAVAHSRGQVERLFQSDVI